MNSSVPAHTFLGLLPGETPLRSAMTPYYRSDEAAVVETLLAEAALSTPMKDGIAANARKLVEEMRTQGRDAGGLDAFMQEYELSNQEGLVLMCLAEALLRVPDGDTASKLIKDKLADADWEGHLGQSGSLFVNASTLALMLTGQVVKLDRTVTGDVKSFLKKLVSKSGEPVIRQAMTQAMKIIGRQFVMGRSIGEALERARDVEGKGYRHSYDMLGEGARTEEDAQAYLEAYSAAIAAVGKESAGRGVIDGPGVSVKLSALHPRFELAQRERVMAEVVPRLYRLAREAKELDIGLCVDAEEADRLDLQLDVLEIVSADPSLKGWHGLGLALQAYQKRAFRAVDWLVDLSRRHDRRFMIRLVKGAYWDTEIKLAQEQGLDGYPVFTRKASTDVSYIACAKKLLSNRDAVYPQFATHNAHTLATVMAIAGDGGGYEFQRLHGMGEQLYDQIVGTDDIGVPCRIYAPVGSHEDLLAYLVRRLLENGANTSFVNRIVDESAPIEEIIADPWALVAGLTTKPHPRIPLPDHIFGEERRNAAGPDLSDPNHLRDLKEQMEQGPQSWDAGQGQRQQGHIVRSPSDHSDIVGTVCETRSEDVGHMIERGHKASFDWDRTPAHERAACLDRFADLIEANTPELLALCVREAGKTLSDAIPEIREAVDFCRYYGARARAEFSEPLVMPGPTGELNEISLHGRGVFACISPWNFPLAIFSGQVTAALAAGNAVIAKPAEQTPLIAARAVAMMHEAGVPEDVLQLMPGDGPTVGKPLVDDPRIAGVAFTGSTETAHLIQQSLTNRKGPIVPLIAETGGQNAMIVDSTALPEQVVVDAVFSAFRSAGQRCSALRVLFVQNDILPKVTKMLAGATEELRVGNPALLRTDVGPVIDEGAKRLLEQHAERMGREAKLICKSSLSDECGNGTFFAPQAYEIDSLSMLEREVFGPVLHVIGFNGDKLDQVVDSINDTGYGLTLGIHSRVDSTIEQVRNRARVGNLYVNRNIIGAVVGVQPFGGEGLSGTGPKAGGPRYLYRFATERSYSNNTTASGGNAALMSL
ncbi:MAG: bifunctional proline dehydrogenase/L-glutamate gamma-semialdehyde dehydrogenase PutA [Rhodospirillales bacterium]|nr:bifunctional proline dehydrogenase/L-glutamate gamma-semialdehyde dehydrogenase PutA [Rhodospirillales bacterium]MBT4038626.1 bifunctional proline dehydrogenase/L-glutamate gamma-semialdehyde dehydrogenase PutA [Rhodospirillales bacterium]MBT4627614.1 bifunctional proline dehydrogenase/L-glutamate gamma-semialdehyde dehydrogenase PutA [Rhodospirillales bacterium]MBT5350650.1 bifunctional proline dehydrogenase/L-glutamate gamma-semialdehyde dehydrogenase PutA [Rhodospirillales bacterium]MBT55